VPALQGHFDAILLDLTDPGDSSLANALYQEDFLRLLQEKLKPDAYLAMHLGSPFYQAGRCNALYQRLQHLFTKTKRHTVSVPLYGGAWDFAYGFKS
jgi:spermidine synthase